LVAQIEGIDCTVANVDSIGFVVRDVSKETLINAKLPGFSILKISLLQFLSS